MVLYIQYATCEALGTTAHRAFSGGFRESSLETKLFHFHGEFSEKSKIYIINNQVKLTNRTPLYKFEPPIKKSWIRPWPSILAHIYYHQSGNFCCIVFPFESS